MRNLYCSCGTFFLILPPKMNKWNGNHFRIQWHHKMICMHRLNNGKWEGWGNERTNEVKVFWILQNRIQIWMILLWIFHMYNMCADEIESVSDSMAMPCQPKVWTRPSDAYQWFLRPYMIFNFLWRIQATRRRISNARKMCKNSLRRHLLCSARLADLSWWENSQMEALFPWHCSTHFFSLLFCFFFFGVIVSVCLAHCRISLAVVSSLSYSCSHLDFGCTKSHCERKNCGYCKLVC